MTFHRLVYSAFMNVRRNSLIRLSVALLLSGSIVATLNLSTPLPTRAAASLPYHVEPATTASSEVAMTSLVASGSMNVWQDSRSGTPDIYAYDLADGREFRVARTAAFRTQPAVDGTRIVWVQGGEIAHRTIQGYDLSEGGPLSITTDAADVSSPAISGDIVVWRQRQTDGWRILAKNLVTDAVMTLPGDAASQANPTISGTIVVWQEYRDNHWSIVKYDLQSQQRTVLTKSNADETNPSLSGDELVFLRQAQTGGTAQLIAVDLKTGQEHVIVADHIVQQPRISSGLIVWEDWRSGLPDIYAFDIKAQVMYAVARSQQAFNPAVSEHNIAWISRSDSAHGRVQAVSLVPRLPTDPQDPPAVPSPDNVYFPETHHFMSAGFKTFWQGHGGSEILGYPLTEEFSETDPATGEQITVQYFQRAKLEYRTSADEGNRISIARLGVSLTADRHFAKVQDTSNSDDRRFFPETGHTIAFGFKDFWEAHGGLAAFGYPISEEFTENGRTVQYFERARFEFNPNSDDPDYKVTLGLLGQEALERMGWLPMPTIDTTQLTH
jgi:beta propeller repeat protein